MENLISKKEEREKKVADMLININKPKLCKTIIGVVVVKNVR